jgi:hypothetical protein
MGILEIADPVPSLSTGHAELPDMRPCPVLWRKQDGDRRPVGAYPTGFASAAAVANRDVTAERDKKPFEFWLMVVFYAVVGAATAVTGILYMFRIID